MNTKAILSLVIGIFMISSLDNVSAGEVGLWMSYKNSIGSHGSINTVFLDNALIKFEDGSYEYVDTSKYEYTDRCLNVKRGSCAPIRYTKNAKPISVDLAISVKRHAPSQDLTRVLTAQVRMPVADNGWVNGISKTEGGTGMYFTASDVYSGGAYMDWIRCYDNDRGVFDMPGGKYHWEQGWSINYPNGQDWT